MPLRWGSQEIRILWGFVGGDVSAAMLPALIFTAAAIPMLSSWPRIVSILLHTLLYFACFGLCFTIANQVTSVEEDRLNKPHRPLVCGLLTVRGAWVRWGIWTLMFLALGIDARLLLPTLTWIGVSLSSAVGWDRAWLWKQVMMALGVCAQLLAAWQPATPLAAQWILVVALGFAVLVVVQDLRDVSGDQARGRRTLPIVWEERSVRWFLVGGFLLMPLGLHLLLGMAFHLTLVRLACEMVLASLAWSIAWRLRRYREPRADYRTYLLFTLLYCGLLTTFALVEHG